MSKINCMMCCTLGTPLIFESDCICYYIIRFSTSLKVNGRFEIFLYSQDIFKEKLE
jgi:hypothetical protein